MYKFKLAIKTLSAFIAVSIISLFHPVCAQQGDNGNGTYTNPIIWADFPDNDVVRVGDTY